MIEKKKIKEAKIVLKTSYGLEVPKEIELLIIDEENTDAGNDKNEGR
jgi:hypothetical protein